MSKDYALRVPDYLAHIVEAIDRIHRYVESLVLKLPRLALTNAISCRAQALQLIISKALV